MIDLDIDAPWQAPGRPARRGLGSLAVVLVVLALLGVAVGDSRRAPRGPLLDLHGDVRQIRIAGDTLFTVGSTATTGGSGPAGHLRAYRLPSGRPLWHQTVDQDQPAMASWDDVVVLDSLGAETAERSGFAVFDARTGRRLWAVRNARVLRSTGPVLVATPVNADGGRPSGPTPPVRLTGLGRRTGATVWSRTLPTDAAWAFGAGPGATAGPSGSGGEPAASRLYVLDPSGVLHTYDLATGAETASVRLEATAVAPELTVLDGRIAITRDGVPPGDLTASDITDGRVLWRLDPGVGRGLVYPCGAAVCLFTDLVATVVDPVSGARLGTRRMATGDMWVLLGDRAVTSGRAPDRTVLTDLGTGATVRELRGWRLTNSYDDALVPLARGGVHSPTEIAVLDIASGEVRIVGRTGRDFLEPNCTATPRYVACHATSHTVVWPVGGALPT